MCGRIAQYSSLGTYLEELDFGPGRTPGYDPEPLMHFNVPPGTRVRLLHADIAGLHIDSVMWGWKPNWAKMRPVSNARGEKVATSKFWQALWPEHRVIVLADCWYEWLKTDEGKQPYLIRLTSDKPMFFAGLAQITPGLEPGAHDGCVVITDASEQGMLDIHDRRPVVLTPEMAREWLSADLTSERAFEIVDTQGRAVDDFRWYPVTKALGNARNKGPELIEPI